MPRPGVNGRAFSVPQPDGNAGIDFTDGQAA
jgi:hypothetical protein